MKPKELKFPFLWEERRPLLTNGVLFVPKLYTLHDQYPLEELNAIFSSFPSICIEYCSGNGTWIAEKAKENPSSLWIAVEKRFDRVQRIWAKKINLSLNNLLVVCGEALTFTHFYLKEELVDKVFVNFPDPWPKSKHAKNRLLQEPFVQEIKRIGKPFAEAIFATDDAPYSEQMIQEMTKHGLWSSFFESPFYVNDWPSYGASYFDDLWRGQGRNIRYMKFIRQ